MSHRTYQTRLKSLTDIEDQLLSDYAALFSQAERTLFAATFAQGNRPDNEHKRDFQLRFGLTARQYNAVVYQLRGKVDSIKALRKDHLADGKQRINSAEKAVNALEKRLFLERKTGAATVKKTAFKLHQKKRRLQNLLHKQGQRESEHKAGTVSMCFGSKRRFNAQHHLEQNGYESHEQWRSDWQASRNSQFMVLGSKDETAGCQGCQLIPNVNGQYNLKLRLPNRIAEQTGQKLLSLNLSLNYGEQAILDTLKAGRAITYRFKKDAKGWRVFVSVAVAEKSLSTPKALGAIGVDVNADHLAMVETNRHGNPVNKLRIPLITHAKTTDQRKAIIGAAVKQLMQFASGKHKPIVIEQLDFQKKKSELENEHNKRYARMLSSLAYNKILQTIKARCHDQSIDVIEVNPAYTSQIGKHKFAQRYGLSVHHGAALTIARRAQRYSEQPNRRDQNASWLPVRKANEHVWSYWRKVAKKPLTLEALHLLRQQSRAELKFSSEIKRPAEKLPLGVGA